MSKKNKYTFVLKNINIEDINRSFGLNIPTNLNTKNSKKSVVKKRKNTTDISELGNSQSNKITFLDESKRPHSCCISMIDFKKKDDINQNTNYNCFWCRQPIFY